MNPNIKIKKCQDPKKKSEGIGITSEIFKNYIALGLSNQLLIFNTFWH
ncbi:MAG: hypothetical protein ACI9RL_001060 [Candidatus Paceibacteria bacterium]|jgi:hypothetical protein